jgi:Icc-related predicted phosphoesterase
VIRVAAVGDVHVGPDCVGCLELESVSECADMLLLAGDLTRLGDPSDARILVDELAAVDVPVISVLGNHDYHRDRSAEITEVLEAADVTVLEGDACTVAVGDVSVGVAGTKGFGGGFVGACGSDFGEPEMKAFVRHTKRLAARLEHCLSSLDADVKIALLHYAPIDATLQGERLEIYPFLGSYLLAEAIDHGGADVVFHGHAHRGSEKGATPGGIKVRNVAKPVIGRPYSVFEIPTLADRDPDIRSAPALFIP